MEPPPPPSTLPDCIDALSEWGVTLDKLKIPPTCNSEEEALIQEVGRELDIFIVERWPEDDWETTWFVNPPVRIFSDTLLIPLTSYRDCKVYLTCRMFTFSLEERLLEQ